METTTISSLVELLLKSGFTLAGLIIAIIGLLAWQRTRSSYMVMARLWLLFNGKQECKIAPVNDFLDEQAAVLQFRFMTGLRAVRTLKQISRLITWSRKNDEDIADIAACGAYFDLEKPAPLDHKDLPGKLKIASIWMADVVLILGILVSLFGVAFDRAVFIMKDSRTVFSMNENFAKTFSQSPTFSLSACSVQPRAPHPGFEKSDIEHICRWASEPGTEAHVAATLRSQRVIFAFAAIYLAYFFLPAYKATKGYWKVTAMHQRIKKRAVPPN